MIYNRIPVTFGQLSVITGATISYQYDVVQMLVINGLDLPDYYTVDFCNVGDDHTVTITGTPDGVRIPDELLLDGRDIKAYIILTGIDEGAVETRYEVTIPVRNRPMRQGVEPTPEERLEIETLVNALNDGVTRAEDAADEAESQAGRAETAAENAETAVTHYPRIEDGYWYVWLNGGWVNTGVKAEGVDGKGIASVTGQKTSTSGLVDTYTLTVTYTDSTTDTITFTVTNGRDGVDGYSPTATVTKSGNTATITITDKNGTTTATVTDGVSPGVTITDITGGHRVTITDKDHPTGQSFDVMDGEVSAADLKAVADSKAPVIIDTASGAIASFSDGADNMPVKSLVCQINPQQDLHGQANPYPAGGGKNKLNNTAETTTDNGVTFTVNADGSVSCSGTATGTAVFRIYQSLDYTESMILNGCPSGGSYGSGYSMMACNSTGSAVTGQTGTSCDVGSGVTIPSEYISSIKQIQIIVRSGVNMNGKEFYPMLRFASVADGTYVPYSNECPISGWTGLNLEHGGTWSYAHDYEGSQYDGYIENSFLNQDGTVSGNSGYYISGYIPIKSNALCFLRNINANNPSICFYDSSKTYISGTKYGGTVARTLTTPNNCAFVRLSNAKGIDNRKTTYIIENYSTTLVSWQDSSGTVYSGSLDMTNGVLTVDTASGDLSTFTWESRSWGGYRTNAISGAVKRPGSNTEKTTAICEKYYSVTSSSIDSTMLGAFAVDTAGYINIVSADGTGNFSGKIVYPLAQPITVQLDPVTVSTLLGENNIWADTGDVSVDYPCDTKLYIDRPTEPAEDDMIADSLIASGKYFFVNNRLFLSTASIAVGAMIIPGSNCTETSIAEALNTLNS